MGVGPRSFYVTRDHMFSREQHGLQVVSTYVLCYNSVCSLYCVQAEDVLSIATGAVIYFDGATNTSYPFILSSFPRFV